MSTTHRKIMWLGRLGGLSSTAAASSGGLHIVKFRMIVSSDAAEHDDDDREASMYKEYEPNRCILNGTVITHVPTFKFNRNTYVKGQ